MAPGAGEPRDSQSSGVAAPGGNADDLLAQLADNEIDRLLAEADSGTKPEPAKSALPLEAPASPPSAKPIAPPGGPASAEESVSAELDNLFAELNKAQFDPPPPMPESPAAPEASAEAAAPAEDSQPGGAWAEEEEEEPTSRPSGLLDEEPEPGLPLFLRPLEWLNAPLANASPETRSLIGKIAIVTFLNALAILVYVLFLR